MISHITKGLAEEENLKSSNMSHYVKTSVCYKAFTEGQIIFHKIIRYRYLSESPRWEGTSNQPAGQPKRLTDKS